MEVVDHTLARMILLLLLLLYDNCCISHTVSSSGCSVQVKNNSHFFNLKEVYTFSKEKDRKGRKKRSINVLSEIMRNKKYTCQTGHLESRHVKGINLTCWIRFISTHLISGLIQFDSSLGKS